MDWEQIKQEIRGPAALMMVPFNEDLDVNYEALQTNIRYMVDRGLRTGRGFIVVPCGTGEYVTLNHDEHRSIVQAAIEAAQGQVPVVAGVASCNYKEAIRLASNARKAGAKCAMIAPPFYYRLNEDAFFEWYRIIAEAVDIGIMIYDQSWRADQGTTITLSLMERLQELPSVVSLKYGSPRLYMDTITALDRFAQRYAFIENSLGYLSTVAYMHGAAGFISGPSLFWPEFEQHFWSLLEAGQYQEAELWHTRLAPYMRFHRTDEFSGPDYMFSAAVLKASLEYVGLYGGPVRPPFRDLTPEQKSQVYAVLDQLGVKTRAGMVSS